MGEKALALRLADALTVQVEIGGGDLTELEQAAAELRRLHDENETLRKQRDEIFTALVQISLLTHLGGEVAEYGDVVDAVRRLKEEKAGLLEALRRAHTWLQGSEPGRAQYLGEVIAKAEGEQT
jgi:hypothetical protein